MPHVARPVVTHIIEECLCAKRLAMLPAQNAVSLLTSGQSSATGASIGRTAAKARRARPGRLRLVAARATAIADQPGRSRSLEECLSWAEYRPARGEQHCYRARLR